MKIWIVASVLVVVAALAAAVGMHAGPAAHAIPHWEPTPSAARAGALPIEPIELPLRVDGGRLVVPVFTDGGRELRFAISTGSAVTVFTESGKARAGGAPLSWGGMELSTAGASTVSDEDLMADGIVLDGMLGSNTLNQFDVLFDVPNERLVIKAIGKTVEWEGMTLSEPLRLRVYHGVVLGMDVELNGRPYPAMLELGTPTLVVNERAWTETEIGADGRATLHLGDTRFPGLPVRQLDLHVIQRFSPNGDGFVMVGTPIAYDCAISISFVHQEMRTCLP